MWGQMLDQVRGLVWLPIGSPPPEPVSRLVAQERAGNFVLSQWPPHALGTKNEFEASPALDTALSGPLALATLTDTPLLSPSSPKVPAPGPSQGPVNPNVYLSYLFITRCCCSELQLPIDP